MAAALSRHHAGAEPHGQLAAEPRQQQLGQVSEHLLFLLRAAGAADVDAVHAHVLARGERLLVHLGGGGDPLPVEQHHVTRGFRVGRELERHRGRRRRRPQRQAGTAQGQPRDPPRPPGQQHDGHRHHAIEQRHEGQRTGDAGQRHQQETGQQRPGDVAGGTGRVHRADLRPDAAGVRQVEARHQREGGAHQRGGDKQQRHAGAEPDRQLGSPRRGAGGEEGLQAAQVGHAGKQRQAQQRGGGDSCLEASVEPDRRNAVDDMAHQPAPQRDAPEEHHQRGGEGVGRVAEERVQNP